MTVIQSIQNRIYELRGQRIMLDFDLAQLYDVETKRLNEAVKRNSKRFPEDFMFRLTAAEWQTMRSQFATASQTMLSGILNSDRAIAMNIAIMRAFVELRRLLLQHSDLANHMKRLQERIGEHDVQLSQIYDVIENMLDEKAAQQKWDKRERIGFKSGN